MKSVLNDILQETKLSRYQIAANLGISKSYVLSVFAGTKSMSEKMFNKMMEMDDISPVLKERLAQSYFSASFGDEGYSHVLTFLACAADFEKSVQNTQIEEKYDVACENGILTSCEQIIGTVLELTKKAKAEGLTLRTNYPFSAVRLNDALFSVCREKDGIKSVDFRHMIYLAPVLERDSIIAYWQILRWCYAGIVTAVHPEKQAGGAFPWLIICSDTVLLFNDAVNQGVVLHSADFARECADRFDERYSRARKSCDIIKDETELLQNIRPFEHKKYRVIDNCICPIGIFDYDMLLNNTNDFPMEKKEYLIKAFLNYYAHVSEQISTFFISDKALTEFAQSGNLVGVSARYLHSFSLADRAEILERFLSERPEDKTIIKDSVLTFPYRYSIEYNGDRLSTHFVFDGSVDTPYEIYMDIPPRKIAKLAAFCENLFTYCANSSFTYTPDQVRFTIEQLIIECKAKAKYKNGEA